MKITKKESILIDGAEYVAVYLDIPAAIDVTTTTQISTMPWWSGTTDAVLKCVMMAARATIPTGRTSAAARDRILQRRTALWVAPNCTFYASTLNRQASCGCGGALERRQGGNSANADYVDRSIRFITTAARLVLRKKWTTPTTGIFLQVRGRKRPGSSTYLRNGIYTPAVAWRVRPLGRRQPERWRGWG